jgi:hypothetical protein
MFFGQLRQYVLNTSKTKSVPFISFSENLFFCGIPMYNRASFVRTSVKDTFGKTAPFDMGFVSAYDGGFPLHRQKKRRREGKRSDLFVKFFKFPHQRLKGGSFVDIMHIEIPYYSLLVDNEKGALRDAA